MVKIGLERVREVMGSLKLSVDDLRALKREHLPDGQKEEGPEDVPIICYESGG